MGVTHHRVSVAQWQSTRVQNAERSEVDSSWGLRIFFLCPMEKTEKHLSLFLYPAQNLPPLLHYLTFVLVL